VIGALFLWEVITRYGRDNLGFIWLFLEPMIFTLAITALWSATGLAHSVNLPIVAFALTGYSSVLLWRNCAGRCCLAVQASVGLLYHRPVRVLDLLLAKILLEIAGASLSFLALSLLWISIGWMDLPKDPVAIVEAWLMLCWFGAALALLVGSLTSFTELAERFWHPIAYIMFPLSGAVFMVDWLSEDARELILLLPMVHCVELMREGFFGTVIRTHHDMSYVALVCLVMTALGLALAQEAGRKIKFA
jgi:capsular polysaccharide transport system permease protein